MKLKAQTEILKDKTTHYETKYQEIDQKLITEIKDLCSIETQPLLKKTIGKELQKGGRKIKKSSEHENHMVKKPTPRKTRKTKKKKKIVRMKRK